MSTTVQSSSSVSSNTVPNHLLRQALESLASSSSVAAPFLKPGQTTSTNNSVDQPTMVSLMASACPAVYNAPPTGCLPAAAENQGLTSEKITSIANEALRILQQGQDEANQPVVAQETTNDRSTLDTTRSDSQSVQRYGTILAPRPSNAAHSSTVPPSSTKVALTPHAPTLSFSHTRLNKFVRRLYDMLQAESSLGIVEWRRGLLVLHSTAEFTKHILPRYFHTRNFKTFRRQLNYYGFVHVRSFSSACCAAVANAAMDDDNEEAKLARAFLSSSSSTSTPSEGTGRSGNTTTALWVNRHLAQQLQGAGGDADSIASVLLLRRVEPCETAKTAEGRRVRKEQAIHTVEEDLGVSPKTLQMDQIRTLAMRGSVATNTSLLAGMGGTLHTATATAKIESDQSGKEDSHKRMVSAGQDELSLPSCSSQQATRGPPTEIRFCHRGLGRFVSCSEEAAKLTASNQFSVEASGSFSAAPLQGCGDKKQGWGEELGDSANAASLLLFLATSKT